MKPFFLFAPGAGAPSSHPWMEHWKQRLTQIGDVEMFNYDYMREGRKRPDRLPQLIAMHRAALAQARTKTSGRLTGCSLVMKRMSLRAPWKEGGGGAGCSAGGKLTVTLSSQPGSNP